MREIKFRAWDKAKGRMLQIGNPFQATYTVDDDGVHFGELVTFGIESDDRYKLMQYTGLRDKNGVEMYEGDVLRNATDKVHGHLRFEVKWESRNSRFVLDSPQEHGWHGLDATTDDSNEYIEVIGNIYENPELLKGD